MGKPPTLPINSRIMSESVTNCFAISLEDVGVKFSVQYTVVSVFRIIFASHE